MKSADKFSQRTKANPPGFLPRSLPQLMRRRRTTQWPIVPTGGAEPAAWADVSHTGWTTGYHAETRRGKASCAAPLRLAIVIALQIDRSFGKKGLPRNTTLSVLNRSPPPTAGVRRCGCVGGRLMARASATFSRGTLGLRRAPAGTPEPANHSIRPVHGPDRRPRRMRSCPALLQTSGTERGSVAGGATTTRTLKLATGELG